MRIVNNDSQKRSWFAYNYEDTSQATALASDPIASGDTKDWPAPKNGSGLYTVIIKRDPGGGSIMAAGAGPNSGTFTFNGKTLVVS